MFVANVPRRALSPTLVADPRRESVTADQRARIELTIQVTRERGHVWSRKQFFWQIAEFGGSQNGHRRPSQMQYGDESGLETQLW